jgi:spore germination protein GerM
MPRDIKELLNEGASQPTRGPNMDAILRRSRTITWQRRAGAAVGVVALMALAFVVGARVAPDQLSDANDNINPIQSPNPDGTPAPGIVPSPEATVPQETEEVQVTYEMWLVNANGDMLTAIYDPTIVSKPVGAPLSAAGPTIAPIALERLLQTRESQGAVTAIPAGTQLLDVNIEGGTATVNLSNEFASGGGSASMQLRVAQVVWTLTQVPQVERVTFQIDGEPVTSLGGEGIDLSTPQTRNHSMEFAPPIVVDQPDWGADVSSPVKITGTANVFEANVSIRITDAAGNVLKEDFITATCGTGCRGDYGTQIDFKVNEPTQGFMMVYEASAENGEPINVIRFPVTLLP